MIHIPAGGFDLLPHQAELIGAWQEGARFLIARWHRQAGKGLAALSLMVLAAVQRAGTYAFISPNYPMSRRNLWDAIAGNGQRYLDVIPPELIVEMNQNEMGVVLRTIDGRQSRLFFGSADRYDTLRGLALAGCILDEYAHHDGDDAYRVVSPSLAKSGGWLLILSTPRGRTNHFETLWQHAAASPEWWVSRKTIADTGLIPREEIERQRREGQHDAWLDQEYFVKATSALDQGYYTDLLERMQAEGRLGTFPLRVDRRVTVALDLGVANATVATSAQEQGDYVTLVDCLAIEGANMAEVIRRVRAQGYDIGTWIGPHDLAQRQQTGTSASGRAESRLDVAKRLGVRFKVVPIASIDEGIDAVRRMMATRLRIDVSKCAKLVEALEQYQKIWDPSAKVFRDRPLHNWASDYADSLRYLCLGWRDGASPEEKREALARRYGPDGPRARSSGSPDGARYDALGDPVR